MGRLAKLLSFVRTSRHGAKVSDVKVNRGGGDNRTLEHFSAPGDDAHPLPGDYVAALPQSGTGRDSAVGYLDPLNDPKANAGDKRIYARGPDTGLAVCEVWLQNDGAIVLAGPIATLTLSALGSIKGENANGSYELTVAGAFLVNGATISKTGEVATSGGIDLDTHTHAQGNDSGGSTEAETDPPS